MDKKEYVFRTLSRTKRKDDENFVINSIWNKLSNPELMPVSQQYVNCGDKWYLIDLFFPQINVGVEVDEQHHLVQVDSDQIRSDQIMTAMKYDKREDFTIYRIPTHSDSYEELVSKIDKVVDEIKKRIRNLQPPLKWISREDKLIEIRDRGLLSIYDDISFYSITQSINELFDWGRQVSKGPSRSYFKYKHDRKFNLWFAKRNVFKNDQEVSQSGWINRISRDGKTILEFHENTERCSDSELFAGIKEEETQDYRITFLKYKTNLGDNAYRFVGKYHKVGKKVTTFNGEKVIAEVYSRIKEEVLLPMD